MSYLKFFVVWSILLGLLLSELSKQFDAASRMGRVHITLENEHE